MMMAGRIGYRLSSLLLALNKGATHASHGQARGLARIDGERANARAKGEEL
jgi:hypothetical protein